MRRRAYLTALSTSVVVGAGCLGAQSPETQSPDSSTGSEPPPPPPSPTPGTAASSPNEQTATGIHATFEVVDGHMPTDDTAQATFETDRVIVTGTMDPGGCRRPILAEVGYVTDTTVRLVVGTKSPYGPTATVECGNASFDYRSVVSVQRDPPTSLELVHDYQDKDDRMFSLERS